MAAHKKNPPEDAAEHIRRLAAEGFGQLGIAAHFTVSTQTFKRWIEEDDTLNEAYELGKETERQALHALVVASARANKPANVNAFFLLKARHGYVETDNRTKVNVDVAVSSVLVVRDHGSDEQWAATVAAQQRALTADSSSTRQIEAPQAPQIEAVASFAPPAILAPVYSPVSAPVAAPVPVPPPWAAPIPQAAPVPALAPSYKPPYDWRNEPSAPAWRPRA